LAQDKPSSRADDTPNEGADAIARGLLAGGAARVVTVISTAATREAASRHGTTGLATVALGRAATAGLLLATLTKDDERVTLQLLGDGALGSLTVDAESSGRVRVFVKNPLAQSAEPLPRPGQRASLAASVGAKGQVVVVRDVGLREPFRGQTSLAGGEIDDDVERYLSDSEQIDSALACDVFFDEAGRVSFAGGVLVQALPGSEGSEYVEAARTALKAGFLAKTVAAAQEDGRRVGCEALASGLVGQESGDGDAPPAITWLDRRPVVFHCPCSKERAAATLALLDEDELTHMLASNEQGQVTCNFCRRTYSFSSGEIDAIRADVRQKAGARS